MRVLIIINFYKEECLGPKHNLSEERCSCSTQVVGNEELGVGVDSSWMELPQWLQK